jgi:hypothetical protein
MRVTLGEVEANMAFSLPGQPLKQLGGLLFQRALKATTAAVPLGIAGGATTPIETGLSPMWNALVNALLAAVVSWVGVYILPANKPTV